MEGRAGRWKEENQHTEGLGIVFPIWFNIQKSISVFYHVNNLRKEKPYGQIISINTGEKSFNKP